jgi:hypothetical protein
MSTQTYELTEQDWAVLHERSGLTHFIASWRHVASRAYGLGFERGRVVKPLVWHWDAELSQWLADSQSYEDGHAVWQGSDGHWYTRMEHDDHMFSGKPTPFHPTEETAKTACEECHEQFVLSQLL